ncbi:MAG: PDDEXK nuclease domain-containing protein [Nanoarchaeota archaeon]|nr:PDDEXK nuclease domain-containing protein [Nanoarchaeota archaeon]
MKKQTKNIERIKDYNNLLNDIKSILQKGLTKAYKAVDNIKVQTYWQIGERIAREELDQKRADYGKRAIESLARDISLSRRSLYEIVQFYMTYPIVRTVSAQLSWSHYTILMKIEDKQKREFYEFQSVQNSWSFRELKKRINSKEFERARKKGEVVVRLQKQLPAPEDVFKESYDWDFLELEKSHEEKELEKALLNKIEKVLLEFGKGFAFMGSQLKILIAGQYHKIDLVFYNRLLKCIVLVELKTEKFRRDFVAQMNEYLTYVREHDKLEGERDPIGLIICKEKDEEEVHYALGRLKQEIFVAEYKTKLPSEKEIEDRIKK